MDVPRPPLGEAAQWQKRGIVVSGAPKRHTASAGAIWSASSHDERCPEDGIGVGKGIWRVQGRLGGACSNP